MKHLSAILTGVALGAIILLAGWVANDRHDRITNNQRQICAIERYVVTRFEIDKAITTTPPDVFARRLAAIRQLEHEIGLSCHLPEGVTP